MSFHDVRLPDDVEAGAQGGPSFKTAIVEMASGVEARNIDWQNARQRWDIGYGIQTRDEFIIIKEFFYARRGRAHGFRFKEWSDYQAVDQELGTGNGSNELFQLVVNYETDGPEPYVRVITRPIEETIVVKDNGVITTAWVLDSLGIINFNAAPANGHVITASFEFDVPVRFDVDEFRLRLEHFDAGEIPNLPIIEIREGTVAQEASDMGIIAVKEQVFTSSGTYTPSAGMLYCVVEAVGGGGGGGGVAGSSGSIFTGAGGGAGGYSSSILTAADIGASKAVTIGAAGAGATTGANTGGTGGDTSLGSLVVAKGGIGGTGGSSSAVATGGAGGAASSGTGTFKHNGAPGGSGFYSTSLTIIGLSGFGGSSRFGGGAPAASNVAGANPGVAASLYGSGGGGGYVNNSTATTTGGAGSAGLVLIREFCSQV